jgi:DNA mismatch repair protein MutH
MSVNNQQADLFMPAPILPPKDETQLLKRSHQLAGLQIGQIAQKAQLTLPRSKKHGKGFVGQLLEQALGASAGNKPQPDFQELDIELKTLPVSPLGKVSETTFVCSIDLRDGFQKTWRESRVYHKLSRVLWVPVEDDPAQEWTLLRVGLPFIWSPTPAEESVLSTDWHDHMNLIAQGLSDGISAQRGEVLQIRPKAANSRVRRIAQDAQGDIFAAKPIGFYLRRQFTQQLLDQSLSSTLTT